MTEIPEHLLKRSRERRAAADAGGDDAGGGESSAPTAAAPSAAVAKTAASMPAHEAPAGPPPVAPPSPMVEAFNNRKKIPFWAMGVLAFVPLWAWVYVRTLDPPPAGPGPLELGTEAYAGNACAGCHGGTGGGGVGPAFTNGDIYATWPKFEDHFHWVRLGSTAYQAENGDTYGANDKPIKGGMPGFSEESLSDAELVYIVLHEREALGGENPDELDQLRLEAVADLMFHNDALTLEEALTEIEENPPASLEAAAG